MQYQQNKKPYSQTDILKKGISSFMLARTIMDIVPSIVRPVDAAIERLERHNMLQSPFGIVDILKDMALELFSGALRLHVEFNLAKLNNMKELAHLGKPPNPIGSPGPAKNSVNRPNLFESKPDLF